MASTLLKNWSQLFVVCSQSVMDHDSAAGAAQDDPNDDMEDLEDDLNADMGPMDEGALGGGHATEEEILSMLAATETAPATPALSTPALSGPDAKLSFTFDKVGPSGQPGLAKKLSAEELKVERAVARLRRQTCLDIAKCHLLCLLAALWHQNKCVVACVWGGRGCASACVNG
jgi:hypothetical protein